MCRSPPMRPFSKLREKLHKFSQITKTIFKDKNHRPKGKGWKILPDESAQHLMQSIEDSSPCDVPDNARNTGTIGASTDSLAVFLDSSRRVRLDPGAPKPLADNRGGENDNNLYKIAESSLIVPHLECVPSDGARSVAHPSPKSLISDDPTIINPFDTPLNRTSSPKIHEVAPDPAQENGDAVRSAELLKTSSDASSLSFIDGDSTDSTEVLQGVHSRLVFPPSARYLDTWMEEVLTEYKANPNQDTPFRQWVHRQRIVEWRRYRVRRTFVDPEFRGEYFIVKVQDAASSETRFLSLDRIIHPMDADFWKRDDNLEDWLKLVETEGCFDLEIDPHVIVTWDRKGGLPDSRDLRLIFGRWKPYDRVGMLKDWPYSCDKREGHVFEPNDQPDLLDLFIAARAIHLDANFSMFSRQDHWFTKLLSRVLNQKWDKYDVLSVADKDKWDIKFLLQKNKWDRIPVSYLRHQEVLKLICVLARRHQNMWKLFRVTQRIMKDRENCGKSRSLDEGRITIIMKTMTCPDEIDMGHVARYRSM